MPENAEQERDERVAWLCSLIAENHRLTHGRLGRDFAELLSLDGMRAHRRKLEAELATLLAPAPEPRGAA